MKTVGYLASALLLAFLSTINYQLSTTFAQGSLTPPGAPAPTMKTLDQIEPRTPISSAGFVISTPGSYYLTANLVSSGNAGIVIATNDVTLDLNGFTISSSYPGNFGSAILLQGGYRDIVIYNGHILSGVTNNGSGVYSGPGYYYGIICSGATAQNVRVSGVTISGVLSQAILLGTDNSTLIENCEVHTIGGFGIEASTVKSSTVLDCAFTAITGDHVNDCRGQSTGSDGISASTAVENSYGYGTNTSNYGIYCQGTAQNCSGYSNGGGTATGIFASVAAINCYGSNAGNGYGIDSQVIENCQGISTGNGVGIFGTSVQNCFGSSTGSGFGISCTVGLNSYGVSASGTGISAFIANGCHGAFTSSGGTAFSVTHNVNSF